MVRYPPFWDICYPGGGPQGHSHAAERTESRRVPVAAGPSLPLRLPPVHDARVAQPGNREAILARYLIRYSTSVTPDGAARVTRWHGCAASANRGAQSRFKSALSVLVSAFLILGAVSFIDMVALRPAEMGERDEESECR